jgi:hypothetical protein
MPLLKKYYYSYRSAKTGRFVSKAYAERYPASTIRIKRLKTVSGL